MKITTHTLVKNEERFVWYAVTSYIDYVDRVLLWDTGSTDNTPGILKELKKKYPDKIDLRFLDSVTVDEFTKVRQEMLDITKSDWFMVSDADEIWWEDTIKNLTQAIKQKGNEIESIFTPTILLIGDMFHYQEKKAGKYKLGGKTGHFGLKAVNRKILGLSSLNPHGSWGWVDGEKIMIQDRDPKKLMFLDAPFLHASFLQRSGSLELDKNVPKRDKKYKIETGIKFPLDFYYPESFFKPKPGMVDSLPAGEAGIWKVVDSEYKIKAALLTPLKKLRRRIMR